MSYNNGPKIVTDGLVVYLDPGNNKSYPGSGSSILDLSTNNNNGTLQNGAAFNSVNGGCISFDGSNDQVNCGNNSTNPTNNITALCFMKSNLITLANYQSVIARVPSDFSYNSGFELSVSSAKARCTLRPAPGLNAYSNMNLNSNQWYMIGFTFDNAAVRIFVNGKLDYTLVPGSMPTIQLDSTSNLLIGRRATGEGFNGVISSVFLYNRALSSAEVAQNYNAVKGRFQL